jgi:hypothetical protein
MDPDHNYGSKYGSNRTNYHLKPCLAFDTRKERISNNNPGAQKAKGRKETSNMGGTQLCCKLRRKSHFQDSFGSCHNVVPKPIYLVSVLVVNYCFLLPVIHLPGL